MMEAYIGEIRIFSSRIIPKGWLPCDGQILDVARNQALFSVIGNRFGGDGRTTFALPDMRGRTPVHMSEEFPLATEGGEEKHLLTTSELPIHTHTVFASTSTATTSTPKDQVWAATNENRPIYADKVSGFMSPGAIGTAGGHIPHNNMQPYTVLLFCIAVIGEYPPHG